VSVLLPVTSDPAGMLIRTEPPFRVVAAELYGPAVSVTVPVGGLPLPPLTTTVTESGCAVVILEEDGVTVIVGVVFTGAVAATVTEAVPEALL
jgi:hypothetical protein